MATLLFLEKYTFNPRKLIWYEISFLLHFGSRVREKEEKKSLENNKNREIYQFNHSSTLMKINVIGINEFHLSRGVEQGSFCL